MSDFMIDSFNWSIDFEGVCLTEHTQYILLKEFLVTQLKDGKCKYTDHEWWEAFSPDGNGDDETNKEFFKELFNCEVPTDGLTDIIFIEIGNGVYVWQFNQIHRNRLDEELAEFVKIHGKPFLEEEAHKAIKDWVKAGLSKNRLMEIIDSAIVEEIMEDK